MTTTDERAVAIRIAHRMSQIGWVEDNDIFKALSEENLPAVELLVDGVRYRVNVERVEARFQPDTGGHRTELVPYPMADGALQGVLF